MFLICSLLASDELDWPRWVANLRPAIRDDGTKTMATLKEFEEALKAHNMVSALAVLEKLRARDKARRTVARARRVTGRKMTPELAREVLDLHRTTVMTQQEIAFKVGVNQGRVNEVIKHGKWLSGDPTAPEAVARDRAMQRMRRAKPSTTKPKDTLKKPGATARPPAQPQLSLGDF